MSKFKELSQIDCGEFIEKKGNLSYISWASAWQILCDHCPGATYEHHEWLERPNGEVMVFCTVTVDGISHKAHLPVLDHRNNPVKNPTVFQINTSMQRCFAKAISMHGLGLYVYRGEDLPPAEVKGPYEMARDKMGECMEFHEYVQSLDSSQAEEAFSGAPAGEKTKFKTEWRTLIKEAEDLLGSYVTYISEAIEASDAVQMEELAQDFTKYERGLVWSRLTEEQRQAAAQLKESK